MCSIDGRSGHIGRVERRSGHNGSGGQTTGCDCSINGRVDAIRRAGERAGERVGHIYRLEGTVGLLILERGSRWIEERRRLLKLRIWIGIRHVRHTKHELC